MKRFGYLLFIACLLSACHTAQGVKQDVHEGAEVAGEAIQKGGESVGKALQKGGEVVGETMKKGGEAVKKAVE